MGPFYKMFEQNLIYKIKPFPPFFAGQESRALQAIDVNVISGGGSCCPEISDNSAQKQQV